MSCYNPYPEARWFALRLRLSGAGKERRLRLAVNDAEQISVRLDGEEREFCLRVRLEPGPNRFDFTSAEPAVRLSQERRQLRMFAVHTAEVRLADEPERPES